MFRFFFVFKQKTAYEMRISDWSSDVCSSDLRIELSEIALARLPAGPPEAESDEGGGELGALLDFPLKFRLGRLALDEIALGDPVLGPAAPFSLTGHPPRGAAGTPPTTPPLHPITAIPGPLPPTHPIPPPPPP